MNDVQRGGILIHLILPATTRRAATDAETRPTLWILANIIGKNFRKRRTLHHDVLKDLAEESCENLANHKPHEIES